MDVGTISLVVILGLIILLAIGMPLGLASGALALVVMILKFEPTMFTHTACYFWAECEGQRIPGMLTARPGTGALYLLLQKIFDLMTEYVLLSVPLFIFMAALLERSGIAKSMYDALNYWLSRMRGGIAVVTSLMAVIMAAMSGIIGGEVVLLGLIALPQMLRLGYNQNLAIGTICASGSLGTMIPPSIVLIIYGLITETSIKNLFTGAFIPGFMLASFIITYILIRTNINPKLAPLPEERLRSDLAALGPDDSAARARIQGELDAMAVQPQGGDKAAMFGAFLSILFTAAMVVLLARVLFFTATGQNILEEGEDPIGLGMPIHIAYLGGLLVVGLGLAFGLFGMDRLSFGWRYGKGLVAPFVVIGVVLGSIYGGITGITEAAGMGALAVYLLMVMFQKDFAEWVALVRGHAVHIVVFLAVVWLLPLALPFGNLVLFQSVLTLVAPLYLTTRIEVVRQGLWDSMMRTLRSTGTIIWVTIGAAALAGAYTLAGGPNHIASMIVGSEMPTMLVLLSMMVILLFMGAFMDWVGIVLLIIPVFLPIVKKLPIEEIGFIGQLEPKYVSVWFGVLFCMNMQVSFLSPPFGPAAFYLKSVAPSHISLTDIFKGFLPFICIQLCALSVLLIWPPIVELLLE
ncbi:TRAP-type C4-dicarboxylate transport system, large permease component [Candidatus Rhodobacter oscarellae]|uniref:TRAP-type C4-dicarboxylate transport system, large permease component n=1 Tax=Candidatus Rhodobacter oscarellae TaxID=1675527 RepID=A0A0J9E4S3_9RHOB|nr:TRAP transporter large permease subunit [Candidatus Rhodobacter lobularis]KMW56819.1 TRAP-type C4-dicarboxylate transport system, large permease component [Candidatus Rhodobacter lobularis]